MSEQEAQAEYERMIGILKENNEDTGRYDKILSGYINKQLWKGSTKEPSALMLEGIPKAFVALCSLREYEEAINELENRKAAILRGDL